MRTSIHLIGKVWTKKSHKSLLSAQITETLGIERIHLFSSPFFFFCFFFWYLYIRTRDRTKQSIWSFGCSFSFRLPRFWSRKFTRCYGFNPLLRQDSFKYCRSGRMRKIFVLLGSFLFCRITSTQSKKLKGQL